MLRVHFRPAGTCVPRRANEHRRRKGPTIMVSGVPQFLVRWEPRYKSLKGALAAGANHSARFSRSLVESRAHLPHRALITSGLLHFAVILFLLYLPLLFLSPETNPAVARRNTEPLFYEVRLVDLSKPLPSVAPPGPGG